MQQAVCPQIAPMPRPVAYHYPHMRWVAYSPFTKAYLGLDISSSRDFARETASVTSSFRWREIFRDGQQRGSNSPDWMRWVTLAERTLKFNCSKRYLSMVGEPFAFDLLLPWLVVCIRPVDSPFVSAAVVFVSAARLVVCRCKCLSLSMFVVVSSFRMWLLSDVGDLAGRNAKLTLGVGRGRGQGSQTSIQQYSRY